MLRIRELPYDDVREVLASDELRSVNEAICNRVRQPIAPESNSAVTLQEVMIQIGYTGLAARDFCDLMHQDREQIVRLAVGVLQTDNPSWAEEEYPPGEEPHEPPTVVAELGLCRTVGVRYTTYLHYLRDRTESELLKYLEMCRIPHRAKFAKELRQIYDRTVPT